jgi:hypothetical protein
MSKWIKANEEGEYVDFDKELYRMPDNGNTSVDIRLTFDTDSRTCYYTISLKNDDGDTRDWQQDHRVSWAVGIAMLGDDVTVPEGWK